jgi:hypothetical protein
MTMPRFGISWSSGKLADRPSEIDRTSRRIEHLDRAAMHRRLGQSLPDDRAQDR